MAERIIAENAGIQEVSYALPNKHYIPVDMRYIGIDNLTPCVSIFLFFLVSGFHFRPFGFVSLSFLRVLFLETSILSNCCVSDLSRHLIVMWLSRRDDYPWSFLIQYQRELSGYVVLPFFFCPLSFVGYGGERE